MAGGAENGSGEGGGIYMDIYANQNFYTKLGLHSTTFNPLDKFSKTMIPPTE